MPAYDRKITISIEAMGDFDDHGEYQPGPSTSYSVWASVSDGGSTDVERAEGTIIVQGKLWQMRWTSIFAVANVNFTTITDETGAMYNCERIAEQTQFGRHRVIEMEGISVS